MTRRAVNWRSLAAGLSLTLLTACGSETKPAAKETVPTQIAPQSGDAAIGIEFTYVFSSNPVENLTVFLLVQDAEGRAVRSAEAVTNAGGIAYFENLPEGEYTLKLWDERNNRWEFTTDLHAYTGSKRRSVAAAFML